MATRGGVDRGRLQSELKVLAGGSCGEIVTQIYYSTTSGVSEEVQRGTLQTITKLGVSILLVFIMITLSLHENSYATSILIGTFSVSA